MYHIHIVQPGSGMVLGDSVSNCTQYAPGCNASFGNAVVQCSVISCAMELLDLLNITVGCKNQINETEQYINGS